MTEPEEFSEIQLVRNAQFYKVMANPIRLAILQAVAKNEMTMTQLSTLLKRRKANISQQLSLLYRSGFLQLRQQGRYHTYKIAVPAIIAVCHMIREIQQSGLIGA